MENIMVCVTGQKTCQRLIDYGKNLLASEEDRLFVIHVSAAAGHFLDTKEEGEALDFLYEKAMEAGASLTVEKADDVIGALARIAEENGITKVVAGQSRGESREVGAAGSFLDRLKEQLTAGTELIVVPAIS